MKANTNGTERKNAARTGAGNHGIVPEDYASFSLFEVREGFPDLWVAGTSGKREDALRSIQHYALMYGQDGPVRIEEDEEE